MIRFIVLLVVGLGAGAVLAFLMVRDPGYVLVSYDGSTIETSLWFALACLVLLALLVYLLVFLIRRLARSGFAVSGWFRWRRTTKARNRSLTGVMLLAEGRWSDAKRALLESADRVDTPLANLLAAARSANELGEHRERDEILTRARESTPQADFVVELVRAELQQVAGQWARSIATLNALRQQSPQHPMVLKRLLVAHEKVGDYDAVAELAPSLPKDAAPDMATVQAAIWRARFAKCKASADAAEHARKAWKAMPKKLRTDEFIVMDYVDALADSAPVEAEGVLRRALKKQWREAWILRYGSVESDPVKQLAIAKQWLKSRPDDPVLLLTLGRLAGWTGNVEEAMSYLEASLESREDTDTLAELGRLCSSAGQVEAANDYLSRAVEVGDGLVPSRVRQN
ncbi:MAG: hypothetical protein F4029_13635 [Gammaproteobacteria bacterium]|nr:hypothetical protein [Gammaproteobacteria bacterium]MYF30530.1 hypothetical protein [Gammaproteobacteria bacterium]MYK47259.1 hypothetical protein [Gammaproteobacteria bacterium]